MQADLSGLIDSVVSLALRLRGDAAQGKYPADTVSSVRAIVGLREAIGTRLRFGDHNAELERLDKALSGLKLAFEEAALSAMLSSASMAQADAMMHSERRRARRPRSGSRMSFERP